ncbi:hypothetical protein C7W93_18585 [Glaciimonas sp. PCH181]|nr:hypothetical protein C7W93_18585 [Glaciimonas sp. PCH181]
MHAIILPQSGGRTNGNYILQLRTWVWWPDQLQQNVIQGFHFIKHVRSLKLVRLGQFSFPACIFCPLLVGGNDFPVRIHHFGK